jgi:hypothetical protein
MRMTNSIVFTEFENSMKALKNDLSFFAHMT